MSLLKKRSILWAEWPREDVLEPVPHRHAVITMPRLLRGVFRKRRELLLELGPSGAEAIDEYARRELGEDVRPGIVVSVATSGALLQWRPHLHILGKALRPIRLSGGTSRRWTRWNGWRG